MANSSPHPAAHNSSSGGSGAASQQQTQAVLSFELFPHRTLTCLAYTGVTNADVLRSLVSSKSLDVALLSPAAAPALACVHVAANKALFAADTLGRTSAASVHAELVYALHGGTSVAVALRVMCPPAGATELLVCCFDASDALLERVRAAVDGVAVTDVGAFLGDAAVRIAAAGAGDRTAEAAALFANNPTPAHVIGRTACQDLR